MVVFANAEGALMACDRCKCSRAPLRMSSNATGAALACLGKQPPGITLVGLRLRKHAFLVRLHLTTFSDSRQTFR